MPLETYVQQLMRTPSIRWRAATPTPVGRRLTEHPLGVYLPMPMGSVGLADPLILNMSVHSRGK